MLSPRSLIYASNTLQYHCKSAAFWASSEYDYSAARLPPLHLVLSGTEIKSDLVPSRAGADLWGGFLPAQTSTLELRRAVYLRSSWEALLGANTMRKVTKDGDKLVAFAAVVEHFQLIWKTSQYLAGLWRHILTRDLLWNRSGDLRGCRKRPPKYRAPSWSWACIHGPIHFGISPGRSRGLMELQCHSLPGHSSITRAAIWKSGLRHFDCGGYSETISTSDPAPRRHSFVDKTLRRRPSY